MSTDPNPTDNELVLPTIRRLEEAVVNRIAAGEIIHRPANALKELIENALDAKATTITISVKDGGLKLLQIQDNGHGIKVSDMAIVCERFTTSKLRSFDDLSSMSTYGFRGEALASISHVGHVTITTKTKDSKCAYKASYSDGVLSPPKPGAPAEPKPCAGNNGTQITVQDLFYNVPSRRKALQHPGEEYTRVLDVVNRYAIHNEGVSFVLRKVGANSPDVHTTTTATILDNIRTIYGSKIANELLALEKTYPNYSLKIKAWISNANYNVKKFNFLLFINHRAVDSPAIRKAIEAVYVAFLPKNTHPWVYLSLEMDPKNVDVNVHPTKKEVHFMNEEEIIASICDAIQERLGDANASRTFLVQTFLPQSSEEVRLEKSSKKQDSKPYAYDKVRTDSRAQKLDQFFIPESSLYSIPSTSTHKRVRVGGEQTEDDDQETEDTNDRGSRKRVKKTSFDESDEGDEGDEAECSSGSLLSKIERFKQSPLGKAKVDGGAVSHGRIVNSINGLPIPVSAAATDLSRQDRLPLAKPRMKRQPVEVKLKSILHLRDEFKNQGSAESTSFFEKHVLVGVLDNQRGLIQNEKGLYLVNYEVLSEELFYQICLLDFSNFGHIRLSKAAPIKELVLMALDDEQEQMGHSAWPQKLKPKEEIAETVKKHLVSKREMLQEYFSISITEDGHLSAIPLLIKGYIPNLEKLPDFLWRLGSEVNWKAEMACFRTVSREIAIFYSTQPQQVEDPLADLSGDDNGDGVNTGGNDTSLQDIHNAQFQHMISTVIFPAFKRRFVPPKALVAKVVSNVVAVKDLYRMFQRC
ncbi:MAG: DNA mismatch repair protein Mlh1 [Benniella sp.]|nr:MAG: DNA mismatch repair protein Mlh1 [Benniella sp.]